MYYVKKRYGHELGLSACFRQWRAESHCRHLHGYALSFEFMFASLTLDANNWVIDFGGLKGLKQALVDTFDHKLIVAADDPRIDDLCSLSGLDLADSLVMPHVGCEAFAEYAAGLATAHMRASGVRDDVFLTSVECREHAGNCAIYETEVFS